MARVRCPDGRQLYVKACMTWDVPAAEGQPLTLVCTDVEGSTELWERTEGGNDMMTVSPVLQCCTAADAAEPMSMHAAMLAERAALRCCIRRRSMHCRQQHLLPAGCGSGSLLPPGLGWRPVSG